ncbi:MAG: Hsp20/alpha crystallin family protein [Burkholderiaceae bacterium]
MKAFAELKQDLQEGWKSIAEGWTHMRERTANALTRFKPTERSGAPVQRAQDGLAALTAPSWAMLAGEVFEGDRRIVVRLEVPGMEAKDFDLQVNDKLLIVRGEKDFSREKNVGHYHLLECAYGSFHRAIALPAAVRADKVEASYRQGVLRIELPKVESTPPRQVEVRVR